MKKKAETRKIVKLEKKSGSFIKIYDLYIQRTEGFHVKFFEDKYIYVKQVRLFDIIKVKNLYPRFIFYQKYPNSEQTISPQNYFTINNPNKKHVDNKNIKKDYIKPRIVEKNPPDIKKKEKISLDVKSQEEPIDNDNANKIMAQKNSLNIIKSNENPQEEQNQMNQKEKEKEIEEKIPQELAYDINSLLKRKVYLGQALNSDEISIKGIRGDGNCFYRCLSFFFLNNQEFYEDIKTCIINWINNNYKTFENFFGDDDANNITKETLAKLEFDYIKNSDSWGSHYTISIACLLFNIDIALYIQDNENNYKQYILFSQNQSINNRELCILEYHNNNHFNIIYSKNEALDKCNLFSSIKDVKINSNFNFKDIHIEGEKLNSKYVEINMQSSHILYDEIALFLFSIKENKKEIDKLVKQNPNWNYNYILSKFNIIYPKRLIGKDSKLQDKRKAFRKYIDSYKLDNNNRLCVLNPINKDKEKDKYYKIPYKHEKNLLIKEYHSKFNHCGRDSTYENILKANWYWFGITRDIQDYINTCPECNNSNKFKKLKGKIKIIIENGPHYRYVADIWTIPKEIAKKTEYKYILDIVDHFSKWYYGYLLKTKTKDEVLKKIEMFCELFGTPKILQTDNGGEFKNNDLENFCEENNIKLIHSSPYHPQTNGSVEATHKEIQKYICMEYLKNQNKFNIEDSLFEIIKIHNNKKHSTTKRIPKEIRDLTDKNEIEIIKNEIIKEMQRKNKNSYIINYDSHYVFDENKVNISGDILIEKKQKKTKAKKKLNNNKIPILVISAANDEDEYLIEIKKTIGKFNEGEIFKIKINLLEEVEEELWNNLL